MDIKKKMHQRNIHGLSVCQFGNNRSITDNYGIMNVLLNKKVKDNTIFHSCSISKLITAICVLNLVAEGILNLDRNVNEYLRIWKLKTRDFDDAQPTSLRELLSHCSGIIDAPGSFSPYTCDESPVSNLDILQGNTRFHTGEVTVIGHQKGKFEYSDAGYCVIDEVIRDVTRNDIDFYAQMYIIEPLTLESTFFWKQGEEDAYPLERCAVGYDQAGKQVNEIRACYPNPSGAGLWSTTTELSIIAHDLIQCFHGKGHILPQSQAMSMLSPSQSNNRLGLGVFLSPERELFYSQGWGIGMQCELVGDLQESTGIVVMMNCEPGVDQEHSIIGDIVNEFIYAK